MAEEFQAAEVWWTSPRATLNGCWQNNLIMNMKTASRSTEGVSPDSTFQTTTNWNQAALLVNATSEDQSYMNQIEMIPAANTSCFSMNQEQTSYGYPSSLLQQPLIYDNLDRVSSSTLHLANKTPFWNASAVDLNDNRASSHPRFVPSSYEERPNRPNIKSQNKEMGKKSSGDQPTTFKRPRLEAPSPLPTFKVRKEKLGDRVTALQQLVSPFGKTDTASVLHETIEYIKLLHDQVNVLSTPYMKNGANMQMNDKLKDYQEGVQQQDLKSRGLCLVPVSTTFPVAAPEYWTSNFGSTF